MYVEYEEFKHRDLSMQIAQRIRVINDVAGGFVACLLSGDLTAETQIAFAHRFVDTAELIRKRATAPIVIEGDVSDAPTSRPSRAAMCPIPPDFGRLSA